MRVDSNIIGGVSPLKVRQSSRGGEKAGKATATSRRRGGFAKSAGKRGAGGRNVGGYNVQTRFGPSVKPTFPSSGGTTTIDTSKPYSYDSKGNLQVNTPGSSTSTSTASADASANAGTDGYWEDYEVEHEYGDLESYKKVWDTNKGDLQSKHKDYDAFVKAAEEWWETDAGKAEREKRKKGKYTTKHKRWVPGSSSSSSSTSTSTSTSTT